ncbi:MAG: cohesin domain-containing protein, partial [Bacteroidota bacterium]
MRKLYILLVLILGPLVTVLAQPTMTVGDTGEVCTGETFCVPFSVRDFTNINSLRYSVNYDTAVLRFTTAQTFNADMVAPVGNLGVSLFSEATLGEISFDTWETGDCTDPGNTGVTLPDDEVIFELCFEAVGNYGDQSPISITNTPTSILCTRNATQCNNIGLLLEDGEATLCVREVNLTASDVSGNEGDEVCVDFAVDGFDGISSMQFTVNYDPAFLTFNSLSPNTQIPNNASGAYGLPGDIDVGAGNITVVWNADIGAFPDGVTVVDGTTFFTVCFTIEGSCETSSAITFSDTPTAIEFGNADPDNPDQESPAVPATLN